MSLALKAIGKKQLEQFGKWVPTLATYGGAASLVGLYFTDWKLVLQYAPFYSGKFNEEPRNF